MCVDGHTTYYFPSKYNDVMINHTCTVSTYYL